MTRRHRVLFPPDVSAVQRAALHTAAEEHGIPHTSVGDGDSRKLVLGHKGDTEVHVSDGGTKWTNERLCAVLSEYFGVDGTQYFHRRTAAVNKATRSGSHEPVAQNLSLEEFVAMTAPLLEMEKDAEIKQTQVQLGQLQSKGCSSGRVLTNLRCSNIEGGLLGHSLVTCVNNKGGGSISAPLPPHKFSTHDLVDVKPNKGPPLAAAVASGVVYRIKDQEIVIAVEDVPEDGIDQPLRLEKLANEVTYKRLRQTLELLSKAAEQRETSAGCLPAVLFGRAVPRFASPLPQWKPLNTRLDASQRAAVSNALAAADVALIHGPPGTGKSTAVVELVLQEARRGHKVLVAAASNMAVDNLVERIASADPKLQVVRIGHPARLLPQVLNSSLEAHILRSDNSALAKDCRSEIKAANARLRKLGRKDYAERRSLRAEIRALGKEERVRQQKAVQEVLQKAAVVCATLTGTLSHHVTALTFDLTIIDEAAQALEAACWSAILKAPRAVLAGDHLQLPPTIISDSAAQQGLGCTLFERLDRLYGESISQMLTVQYRMHASIMQWSSQELYQGRITAHSSVATHALKELMQEENSADSEDFEPLLLIDTAGCDMTENMGGDEDSKANPGEAEVAMRHCRQLLGCGIHGKDVAIITPYNAQVALLKDLRQPGEAAVEIGTVDSFQGREKEAIIISMVRSNPKGEVGFLADNRRMNVAVTRARRHCAIVCDSETVSHDPFLKRLVEYFQERGSYATAADMGSF